ncbi:hypothetical protein Rsub_08491 [Raphidocelis subcapitata]|uniref:Uncharacterized protein n=1 Tax=Raphidocelis subcapitata TaxID=307507 RepID=A0A2V0PDC6_9CHLO|nr:hypothetical protein Rsub_08491 [Raphidocelis subcapitata]|eukprot:GBF95900.1 hypothetical protein Rsub_08491 [Raphidocelis subcapitata]
MRAVGAPRDGHETAATGTPRRLGGAPQRARGGSNPQRGPCKGGPDNSPTAERGSAPNHRPWACARKAGRPIRQTPPRQNKPAQIRASLLAGPKKLAQAVKPRGLTGRV